MPTPTRTVYFLCSPSLSIFDNWLPVLQYLRQSDSQLYFVCIIPKSGSVALLDLEGVFIKIAESIFDEVVYRLHSDLWVRSESFGASRCRNAVTGVEALITKMLLRMDRFLVARPVIRVIKVLYKVVDQYRYSKHIVDIYDVCSKPGVLLYDIYEEWKPYNLDIVSALREKDRFSICHGVDVNQDPIVDRSMEVHVNEKLRVYLFSEYEKDYYINTFGLHESHLKVVGIPKHDEDWLERIADESPSVSIDFSSEDHVFLISRPISPYLTYERKKEVLTDIKKLLIDELNINIVVKLHPKEGGDGLFELVFGKENLGSKWTYSNLHPFVLVGKCLFVISFYSSVVVDMARLQVPAIEYLNLRNLNMYDTVDALRVKNDPVLSYRYLGLVLGASDYQQFKNQVDTVLEDREKVIVDSMAAYQKYFPFNGHVSKKIAADIFSSIAAC